MRRTWTVSVTVAVLIAFFQFGCDKSEEGVKEKKARSESKDKGAKGVDVRGGEEATKTEAVSKETQLDDAEGSGGGLDLQVELHKELEESIKKAVSCDFSKSYSHYRCVDYKAAREVFKKTSRNEPAKALETLSVMVLDNDPKIVKVAASLLGSGSVELAFAKIVSGKTKSLDEASAKRLLKGFQKAVKSGDKSSARTMAAAVTFATTVAGLTEEILNAYKEVNDPGVKVSILERLMRYGRMKVFYAIKNEAERDDQRIKAAAVKSPNRMYKWTDVEKNELCPFGFKYLSNEHLSTAAEAARILARCKGEYVEKMLEEGKKRVKAGQWKEQFVFPYRDICFKGFLGRDKIPPEETCNKVYKFLEWVAKQENVEPRYRGMALSMIYYQRRDKKTHKLLRKYRRHKVKEIREAALNSMESLENSYLK